VRFPAETVSSDLTTAVKLVLTLVMVVPNTLIRSACLVTKACQAVIAAATVVVDETESEAQTGS
jgi:hypothetical protein